MSEAIDTEYQRGLAKECVDEILKAKKGDNREGYRAIVELMKRYEDRIFDQYNGKPAPMSMPMPAPQQRTEREASPGLRYPFVSDASFQTNYPRLYRGYENVNPQQQLQQNLPQQPNAKYNLPSYEIADPRPLFYSIPNAKGYDQNFNNMNQFMNRPMHDISNQQHLMNPQGVMGNSFGFQNPTAAFHQSGQYNMGPNALNEKNPYLQGQDNSRLQRNIELLGGIERTLPNMQISLNDNEIRNIDRNYRPQGQYDQTSYQNLLQNPFGGFGNAPQSDYQNIRGASPARGEAFSHYEAQYLRGASPQREEYQPSQRLSSFHSPDKQFATEHDSRWGQYVNARSRDPSGERRLNSARKSGLSTSKDLRNEKAELLGMRYNITGNQSDRDYYN